MAGLTVEYGVEGSYNNVTELAVESCVEDNILTIPPGDGVRAALFGDPVWGVEKYVRITLDGYVSIYSAKQEGVVSLPATYSKVKKSCDRSWYKLNLDPEQRLAMIHKHLRLTHGNFRDEYPEQLMTMKYLPRDAKVLELGSNIGRNTLVIATILHDQRNLVTLECNADTCKILETNRKINQYEFQIENAALSYRPLIIRGWDSIPDDTDTKCRDGYTSIPCITFQDLEKKYSIKFDTLVADCEGALYYIFKDYPDMLDNMKLIIMENDYHNFAHKQEVDGVLQKKGFVREYVHGGGFGPCTNCFYEVWKKSS